MTPIKTANTPELVKKSLAQNKDKVFSATSEERLKLMREIFNGISSETPVRVIRSSTDEKKDVLLRDSSMHEIDYLGSGDKVTLVSDKKITGNTNGYSYIHRSVKIDGVDVNKIYIKVKTDAGQIGYVALEHIGKEETKPAPVPTTKPAPVPTTKPASTPAPAPKPATAPVTKPIAEVSKEDPKAITTVTTLPSGLLVARGPNQSQHPLISQGKMADMVLTYE